jgi:hypothetical protein
MTEFKKYARFDKNTHIQIETRTWHEFPTDNTNDGSEWFEVDEHFPDGKHLIYNDGRPRVMTDLEHDEWQSGINLSGAISSTRIKRNQLLKQSDWVEAAPLPEAKKNEWRIYRQALRDLPESVEDYNVVFPTEPTL